MLPYAFLLQVELACPHCRKKEVRLRAAIAAGGRHRCRACGRDYPIQLPVRGRAPKR